MGGVSMLIDLAAWLGMTAHEVLRMVGFCYYWG